MTTRIRWFDDVGMNDLPAVGGKNASLGEMRRALMPLGIRTPDGFATTADAYRAFLRAAPSSARRRRLTTTALETPGARSTCCSLGTPIRLEAEIVED